jgi:membrane protease YdiL (CAAX protease family)
MDLIHLLITLVIFLVVAYILWLVTNFVVSRFGIPEPIGTIIMLIIGLVILLAFLQAAGLYSGGLFKR